MRVAYLVNQYPKTSHSFIRREIQVVESAGLDVVRISIRRTNELLVDQRDIEERDRTRTVLGNGFASNLFAVCLVLVMNPFKSIRALRSTWCLGWRSRRGRFVHFMYFAEACILRRMCARLSVDHVHAHFATNPATVALLCEDLGGPSFSFTFHGPEFFEFPTHGALGLKVARAGFTVAISHHGRSQLMRMSEREHWERIALIHCGVGPEYFERTPRPIPAAPRLVCVARLDAAKGHFVLLRALALVTERRREFEMVLVGDGELRPRIEQLIRELGLDERVRCVGWKSGDEVIEEILASRALVLPSFEEGLPVVFMEALALERPVVSTFIAGIPELVRDGSTGWLVPASDESALADALCKVIDAAPAELSAYGRRGAELVRANHDARREATRLVQLFETTVREGRGRRARSTHPRAVGTALPVGAKGEAR